MSDRGGFTITELVIALSLSTMVLVGLIGVSTAIVRQHYESIRKGEANATTLYALQQMNRELELATLIEEPSPLAPSANRIRGCLNWSRYLGGGAGGPLDGDSANTAAYVAPTRFVYCIRADGNDAQGRAMFSLMRHSALGCDNPIPTPTCGTPGTGEVVETIVPKRFYTNGAANRFDRTSERRLRLRYTVGVDSATFRVDTTVSPEKSYALTDD